jgi:anti-sigma regulatory factor (Ser/Thr protein kinase)
MPASHRPLNGGHMMFSALATAPFRAREYTCRFLGLCGLPPETIEVAESVVSELATNAFDATGSHAETRPVCAEHSGTAVISLSLRQFPRGLLIEVIDSSPEPPVLAKPDADMEHGRGLWIVAALSREWGYFPVHNGKCVYSMLDITDSRRPPARVSAPPGAGRFQSRQPLNAPGPHHPCGPGLTA